jgi:hypothetical protein
MRARRPDHRVKFLRSLALLSGLSGAAAASACGASSRVASQPPAASTSASAPDATRVDARPEVDPGAPCRCSWDKDANAAPRVCKRGETAFDGRRCVASGRQPDIVEGPLPPPDFASSRQARRARQARTVKRTSKRAR